MKVDLKKSFVNSRRPLCLGRNALIHWGRATYKCVTKLTIIGPDNGLSPGRRQAIIWTNAGILLIRTLGTKFSEILSDIHSFSSKKIPLKMSSGKWCQFCLGLNVLSHTCHNTSHKIVWHTRLLLYGVGSTRISICTMVTTFGPNIRVGWYLMVWITTGQGAFEYRHNDFWSLPF